MCFPTLCGLSHSSATGPTRDAAASVSLIWPTMTWPFTSRLVEERQCPLAIAVSIDDDMKLYAPCARREHGKTGSHRQGQLTFSVWRLPVRNALTIAVSSVHCCSTSTETIRTIRDGESRTATPTFTQLLSSYSFGSLGQCCFTSTETILRTIRDGEPRTATSTFTQLLSSEGLGSRSVLLYAHRDYWAIQAGLLTPLTFARHRLSPLAAFTSGAYFLHNGRRWQWIFEFYTANFKGIFGGP